MSMPLPPIVPKERRGPLLVPAGVMDTKDPCPVFDGKNWHIYGSGGDAKNEQWFIFHAIAPSINGPWKEQSFADLNGLQGPRVAAPSVIFDSNMQLFHMFIQSDFTALGSHVVHLVSQHGGRFDKKDTALEPLPLTTEAGIYDPHAAEVAGRKYLTYSGFTVVSRPDIYLAESESNTWDGPWKRLGRILAHEEVHHHNQHGHHDYEWGLEGSQLIELPSGLILLVAVCFLPEGRRGTRQRVFFAIARQATGPYCTLGTVLPPLEGDWESGENGHAAGVVMGDELYLFYQARSEYEPQASWRYGLARFAVADIEAMGRAVIDANTSVEV